MCSLVIRVVGHKQTSRFSVVGVESFNNLRSLTMSSVCAGPSSPLILEQRTCPYTYRVSTSVLRCICGLPCGEAGHPGIRAGSSIRLLACSSFPTYQLRRVMIVDLLTTSVSPTRNFWNFLKGTDFRTTLLGADSSQASCPGYLVINSCLLRVYQALTKVFEKEAKKSFPPTGRSA